MSHTVVVAGLGRRGQASIGSSVPNGGGFRSYISDSHLAHLLGDSENVLQEFRSLTKLRSMKSALTDKLIKTQNANGDSLITEALLTVVDHLEIIEKRVTNNEARCENLNEMVIEQGEKIEKNWDWLQQDTKHEADAIFRLMKLLHLLEAEAVKDQSDGSSIVVEKHLDDARSCVCLMFVHRFPLHFPRNDLVNVFDDKDKSVIWPEFLARLQEHFFRYHKVKPKRGWDELWQMVSVFKGITGTKALDNPTEGGDALGGSRAGDDAQTDVTQAASYDMAIDTPQEAEVAVGDSPKNPNAQPATITPVKVIRNFDLVATFQPKKISTCTGEGRFFKTSANEHLRYHLEFFIPLFIWTYNDIKKKLHEIDVDIYNERNEKKNQDALIAHLRMGGSLRDGQRDSMGGNPNEKAETLFSLGTGLDVRKRKERRKFVLASRRIEDPEASTYRPGNLKRKANEETHNPDPNEPSSPEKRSAPKVSFVTDIKSMYSVAGTIYSKEASSKRSRSQASRFSGSDILRSPPSDRAFSTSPLSSGVRSVSTAVPQSFVQMTITNAMLRLKTLKSSLAKFEQDRRATLKELHIYRKGLAILLDTNLLKLVTGGRVPVEELTSKSGLSDPQDVNHEVGLIKIADIISKDDDYDDYANGSTGRAIDAFLSQKDAQIAVAGRITDFHILLQWLDTFKPVPSDAEEA